MRGLTDAAGAVVGTGDFDVFGAASSQSGIGTSFGFAGQQTDPTGLLFMRARYMDPATGAFLSPDPVRPGAPGVVGFNQYTYAGNNPTTWTDPTGALVDGAARAAARAGSAAVAQFGSVANAGLRTPAPSTTPQRTNRPCGGALGEYACLLGIALIAFAAVTALGAAIAFVLVLIQVLWETYGPGPHDPPGPEDPDDDECEETRPSDPTTLPGGSGDDCDDDRRCVPDQAYLEGRALEVHTNWATSLGGVFDERFFNSNTVAVLRLEEPGTGRCVDVLGGGATNDLPATTQKIAYRPGEIVARAPGLHAEPTVITRSSLPDLAAYPRIAIAASRPFCGPDSANCSQVIRDAGGSIEGPRFAVWP